MRNLSSEYHIALKDLFEAIQADYDRWRTIAEIGLKQMDFDYIVGNKYIRVITDDKIWGYLLIEDDKKFKKGDILMAANWTNPYRNHARGNIFDEYEISWTGPKYISR